MSIGNVAHKSTALLRDMGFIELLPIRDNPNEKRYKITERGQRVVKYLLEIDKILQENYD